MTDKELIRSIRGMIIAEYDAINLYEKILSESKDERVNAVLSHVIDEELYHVGEFEKILQLISPADGEKKAIGIKEATKVLKENKMKTDEAEPENKKKIVVKCIK